MVGERKGAFDLVEYDLNWPKEYEEESLMVMQALYPRALSRCHIGSTAVPGLRAKPIIDYYVEVSSLADRESFEKLLLPLGYEVSISESGVERLLFRKGSPTRFQLSLTVQGSWYARRTRLFSEYLAAHPLDAARYGVLKTELAAQDRLFGADYTRGKTAFVSEILGKAGALS